jgi:hypothetical protein
MALHLQLDDDNNSTEKSNATMLNKQAANDENVPKTTPRSAALVYTCSCSHQERLVQQDEVHADSVRKSKHVRFSDILIRSYDVTCTGFINRGPGIGLDWFFTQCDAVPLDSYELRRQASRRPYEMLILGPRERIKVLTKMHGCEIQSLQRICSRNYRVTRSATTLAMPAPAQDNQHIISFIRSSLPSQNFATSSDASSQFQRLSSPRCHS